MSPPVVPNGDAAGVVTVVPLGSVHNDLVMLEPQPWASMYQVLR